MMCYGFDVFVTQLLDFSGQAADNSSYIRPLAVRPLNHPEGEPTPWGFLVSGSPVSTTGGFSQ